MDRMSLGLAVVLLTLLTGCNRDESPNVAAPVSSPTDGSPAPPVETTDEAQAIDLATRAVAPLLDGLGDFTHPISSSVPGVQRYFDQGMIMSAGFNHAEGVRAFRAAQRLDPQCAMCFWGEALAIGPNINVTSKGKAIMMPDDRVAAHTAAQRALALSSNATPREKALIAAQAQRYNGDVDSDRDPLDRAYAEAMRGVAASYPDDDDIQAMFAEALMNTMPWDYWLDGENPKPETAEVIAALETVMARNPTHPLTLHLYIHAVEASNKPGRAEAAADALADLVPGSGHLVHMPSHIYWRVGRYHDASEANVRAAQVDEDYIAHCKAQGFYPALYYPHNIHFLWSAASMEGRSAVAIEAGRKVAANVRLEQIDAFPTVEFFHTVPLLSLVRFARWDEILAEPQPREDLAFSNAIWRYARGIALVNLDRGTEAQAELDALTPLLANNAVYFLDGNDYPASQILGIAEQLLRSELAYASGDVGSALKHLETAVAAQDALPYTEPPFWYYPTRQSLGQVLLDEQRFADAEAVYRADLKQYPRNGWSLHGLALALEGQGREGEAAEVHQRFNALWGRADITLRGSVI